ncbi:Major Facilitator Superfamily [Leishmania braziliensis]|nr:Major Facilitator Superfamily [Leishmania braziliensis]
MIHADSLTHPDAAGDVALTSPRAEAKRSLRVSFAAQNLNNSRKMRANRTASQQYELSFISSDLHHGEPLQRLAMPRSPLYPASIIPLADRKRETPGSEDSSSDTEKDPITADIPDNHRNTSTTDDNFRKKTTQDAASGALLIYPKKIDNLRRFRILFAGVILSISSSTQGVHSVFGVLHLQQAYQFNARSMTIVYLSGVSVGLFTLPFGALYDWFGPRVVVALGSVIAALGHLLFALTFGGHIPPTVLNCAVFYAMMCWGCYALNVAVLPAVLTHMPRDRGQPTGLLQTFTGLGASVFACLFRGFFKDNFAHLMWFMFAVTLAAGAGGVWYLEDAPYVINRWQQRRITPCEQLRAHLIRNRYMSQLVPKRRYIIMAIILVLLNLYLTIQTVCVAYLAADITPGKLRGIAIGAVMIVLLVLVLVLPLDSIDGLSEQDKQVIAEAKAKEEELLMMQEERYRGRHLQAHEAQCDSNATPTKGSEQPSHCPDEVGQEGLSSDREPFVGGDLPDSPERSIAAPAHGVQRPAQPSLRLDGECDADANVEKSALIEVMVPAEPVSAHSPKAPHQRSEPLRESLGLPLHKLTGTERPLVTVYMPDRTNDLGEEPPYSHCSSPLFEAQQQPLRRSTGATHDDGHHHSEPPQSHPEDSFFTVHLGGDYNSLHASLSCTPSADSDPEHVELRCTAPSTYSNPRVETIMLCGEVYVVPVYQTTFLESLTYLDLWLMFYTTLCVWGIGLVMTANWNIQIMVKARYGAMEPKHYILFAAMSGVSVAGGRVFLGVYERALQVLRARAGTVVVPTLIYPVASVGLFLGVLFWIALPDGKALILPYILSGFFYGVSTSATFYVLGTIFDRDMGMHYGFCYLGGALGFVLCYWCAWYLTYEREASPSTLGYCVGARRCMNRAVGIYLALAFSSIASSYLVHRRYSKLVRGKLAQRRVIVPRIKRALVASGFCESSDGVKKSRSNGMDGAFGANE